jgi:predicted O-methyltransferase YrrM
MKIERCPLSAEEAGLHQELFENLLRDHGRYGCAIRPHELDVLVSVYKAVRPKRSLEWGLGSGVSAVALGKARQALGLPGKHVVLDPLQEDYGNYGVKCMQKFSALDCIEFFPTTSEEFLVGARGRGELFDFVFIDGAHDVGHKLTDACLASSVLSPNAVICFHDSFFTSTSLAVAYLVENCGMKLYETGEEVPLRRRLRGLKHASRLGWRFAFQYAPRIDFSLSVLRRMN